jgi:uncharacterized membrane protein YfcA
MRTKILFTLAAVVQAIFGLGFLLIPETLTGFYGNTLSQGGVVFARLFGTALLALAAIFWFARDLEDSEALRAIVIGGFINSFVGLLVALYSQLTGMVNELGWSTVIIYFLFALDFGFFLFKKPNKSAKK